FRSLTMVPLKSFAFSPGMPTLIGPCPIRTGLRGVLFSLIKSTSFQFCFRELRMCDFSVRFTIIHQFAVSTDSHDGSFIQNDDFFRMHNRTDSLCHYELCDAGGIFIKGMTKRCICLVVKCGKTVVEEKYFR